MLACTPHPGLGTIAIARPAYVQVVDLATCATTRERRSRPAPPPAPAVHVRRGDSLRVSGRSPDGRWILYSIDRFSSASLAADGLPFFVIRAAGGAPVRIGAGLVYDGYRSWCDFRTLVMTVGVSREAVEHKRLVLFHAPAWRPKQLAAGGAYGSLECAPDGNSVVVQETHSTTYRDPHWSLWRVSLPSGKQVRLSAPAAGYEDDSPHWSPDQSTLYFVRAYRGRGLLYALHGGTLVGPLLGLGRNPGYFGETQWRYAVRR